MIELNYNLEEIVYFCEEDKKLKTEVFKDVPGYEELYQVSDLGRVKNKLRNKILKQNDIRSGYRSLKFKQKNIRVHILVAITFLNHIPCGFNIVVDHKDDNKLNNKASNLQLLTNRQNSTKKINNKTGYIGVNKQSDNVFIASIRDNGNKIYLGCFNTALLAHKAYAEKRKEIESRNLHKQL